MDRRARGELEILSRPRAPGTAGFTRDALLGGRLKFRQPRRGFRVTIDAPLLAFAALQRPEAAAPSGSLLDAGCGVGVIGLAFLLHRPGWSGTLLDLQPEMAALAEENAAASKVANARCATGDLRDENVAPGPCDLILCNPPHFPADAGTLSPRAQKNLSKFELELTLRELNRLLAPRLAPRGAALLIVPHDRARALQDGPLALAAVHPVLHAAGEPPGRAIVVLSREPAAAPEAAPFILYEDAAMKRFTPELAAFLDGELSHGPQRR